jgi:hypothetical protein
MGKGKQLRKALRRSRRAFPFEVGFAGLASLAAWALHTFVGLPSWIAVVIVVFGSFGAVGDGLNIIYCRLGLRRLDRLAHRSNER